MSQNLIIKKALPEDMWTHQKRSLLHILLENSKLITKIQSKVSHLHDRCKCLNCDLSSKISTIKYCAFHKIGTQNYMLTSTNEVFVTLLFRFKFKFRYWTIFNDETWLRWLWNDMGIDMLIVSVQNLENECHQ